jgi:PGF-CTERM protein
VSADREHIPEGDGSLLLPVLILSMLAGLVIIIVLGTSSTVAGGTLLTVTTPREGFMTGHPRINVTGITEADTEVIVNVEHPFGGNSNRTVSSSNGSFELWVYIHANRNRVIVAAGHGYNRTQVERNVTWDLCEPYLRVWPEYPRGVPLEFNGSVDAYLVREPEIFLNGRYNDDWSDYNDILIRINGWNWLPIRRMNGTIDEWLDLEEGPNNLTIEAIDAAGNVARVRFIIIMDTTPPQVRVEGPWDGALVRDPLFTVMGSAEPHIYLEVHVQSVAGNESIRASSDGRGSFSIPLGLFEGLQTIVVYAVDAMGNVNMTMALVTLDTTPPELGIDHPPAGGTSTREDRYVITGTVEPEATVTVDDTPVVHRGVFQATVTLVEGKNTFSVRAVDPAGNERVVAVTIIRDTSPPVLFIRSPQRSEVLINESTLRFEGSVKGSTGVAIRHRGVHHPARLVSGSWDEGSWEFDLEIGGAEAVDDVEVYAQDMAGNRASSAIRVVIDTVPPVLNIDGGPYRVTNRDPFVLSGTTDEDIASITVNGVPYPVDRGVFDLEMPLGGRDHSTFGLVVRDVAGNTVTSTVHVMYDVQVPDLELDYPERTDRDMVVVTGLTDTDVRWVYVDGQSFFVDNGTFTFLVKLDGEGEHRINFTVEDEAGNRRTRFATIDNGSSAPGFEAVMAIAVLVALVLVARRKRSRIRPSCP